MAPPGNLNDLFNVKGMVAVVTGGGSGLGLYAARALDAHGAKAVYIVGRREETLKAAAKTGVNGTIIPLVGDVTKKESLSKVADQVRKEHGFINLLFANAGVMGPPDGQTLGKPDGSKASLKEFQEAMLKTEVDDFTFPFHVNVTSVFFTAIAFLDLLEAGNKKRNVAADSQVLVTSSIAGFNRQLFASFAYSTSKAATNHLVKMLSTTFAQHGFHIRVNLIAPGIYPSEMTEQMTKGWNRFQVEGHPEAFAGASQMSKDRSPAERTGSEEDFAGTVLFMVSRAGAYLNGEALITDGGRLGNAPSTY